MEVFSSPEKIVILDFIKNKLLILDYDSNLFHDVEDFFLSDKVVESHLSINNCEYIVLKSEDLKIEFTL